MQNRGLVQVVGKGLLAGFMPEQCAAGIGPDGPTQKCPSQQRPFGHAPRARPSAHLVEAEQQEGDHVDQRKQAKGVGESEKGGDVYLGRLKGGWVVRGAAD